MKCKLRASVVGVIAKVRHHHPFFLYAFHGILCTGCIANVTTVQRALRMRVRVCARMHTYF